MTIPYPEQTRRYPKGVDSARDVVVDGERVGGYARSVGVPPSLRWNGSIEIREAQRQDRDDPFYVVGTSEGEVRDQIRALVDAYYEPPN